MEFFTATGKLKKFFFLTTGDVTMVTRVWQEFEYRVDVCRVTRGAHIEHLPVVKKKTLSVFLWL